MSLLTPDQVNELLNAAGHGATIHLVGVGGCGMSGLAHLLLDLSFKVTGSDLSKNADTVALTSRGADISIGHCAARILQLRPALVVYSSAIRLDNPELATAQQRQIPVVRRATVLAALVQRRRGICVAGMHGKTTTTGLLAYALDRLGAEPSYAVGAAVPQLERHARFSCSSDASQRAGANGWFAVEADESDGTLRQFKPQHAIVLNVDEEHLDYFANLEAICDEFQQFGEQTTGALVYCADDPRLVELFARRPNALSFGFNPLATYRIELRDSAASGSTQSIFELWKRDRCLGQFSIALLGEKNISNAAAVIAMLHRLGYPPAPIARAIFGFRGAARRQQELFRDGHVRVFDDYGHHPSEVTVTLRALKALCRGRLLVAFQPHRFTRTHHLLDRFATCFSAADQLWVTEIYSASEPPIPGVSGAILAAAVRSRGQPVEFVPSLFQLVEIVRSAIRPGDVVVFIGAGDITKAARDLVTQLHMQTEQTNEAIAAQLQAVLSPASMVRRNEPLARKTTMRVGGPADLYLEPASEADLAAALRFCAAHNLPQFILGRGSNLLVRDGGIRGLVISLAHRFFSEVRVAGDTLHCGAGARLKAVAIEARRAGISGLEFLEGIPGTVGGALRMNAGAMGGAIFDVVQQVRFMDREGNVQELSSAEVERTYRECPLFKSCIALGAVVKGKRSVPGEIAATMDAYSEKRWKSQPAAPSAGCIFKNTPTIPAGRLVQELGLKGMRIGGALVSDVHGNFIINHGNATARDVLALIDLIKHRARSERGIELVTEVEIVGDDPTGPIDPLTEGDRHPAAGALNESTANRQQSDEAR